MTKKGLERALVALLFVLVLIVFSFAERASKKLDRLYTTVQLLKKGAQHPSDVTAKDLRKTIPVN